MNMSVLILCIWFCVVDRLDIFFVVFCSDHRTFNVVQVNSNQIKSSIIMRNSLVIVLIQIIACISLKPIKPQRIGCCDFFGLHKEYLHKTKRDICAIHFMLIFCIISRL